MPNYQQTASFWCIARCIIGKNQLFFSSLQLYQVVCEFFCFYISTKHQTFGQSRLNCQSTIGDRSLKFYPFSSTGKHKVCSINFEPPVESPEQMQSQRNYGSFLSKSHLHGMILFTMLAQNRPKSKRQCF